MTNHEIDNSASELFGKTILWQYDKAVNLRRLLQGVSDFYSVSVEEFWNKYPADFISIDSASSTGLSVWGKFIGIPRPMFCSYNNDAVFVSDWLYKRILKASFFLMKSTGSNQDIVSFLSMIFRMDRTASGIPIVSVRDTGDMAMEYYENESIIFSIPVEGEAISENTIVAQASIYEMKNAIHAPTTFEKMLELDLVRKISDVQSFSKVTSPEKDKFYEYEGDVYFCHYPYTELIPPHYTEIENFVNTYAFREMTIGTRFCHVELYQAKKDFKWVSIEDNIDSLSKINLSDIADEGESPLKFSPFDRAHTETQLLFRTASSNDPSILSDHRYDAARNLLPYPAGVKDNTPFNEIVFGLRGQTRRESSDPQVGSFCDRDVSRGYESTTFISTDAIAAFDS